MWLVLLFIGASGAPSCGFVGRQELSKIKASLGRINDEVHAILGVLDDFEDGPTTALQSLASFQQGLQDFQTDLLGSKEAEPSSRRLSERWQELLSFLREMGEHEIWERLWRLSQRLGVVFLFLLDVFVVIGMALFLESLKRKPRRARSKEAAGAPIPTPTATAGRESSQWLAWLSQEELLAASLKEHWFKFLLGLLLAMAVRLFDRLMRPESLMFHLIVNVSVTLRVVGLALVLLRDSLTFPRADDVARETVNVLAERGASRK